ncbi:MAG: sulfotransferase [Actinomadura sp.]
MRVVYVTGWCRSGSTVLANLLNELPGVVHVGELAYLWVNGVLRGGTNTQCGCGEDLGDCEVWTRVLDRVAGGDPAGHAREMVADHEALLRTRHIRARLAEAGGRVPVPDRVGRVTARMAAGYAAIGEVTGAKVIVDSSKFPAEAAALCGAPGLDVRVLHLVRDPRATAYSWRRAKAYIPAMGTARSSGYWTAFNLASELIARGFPDRCLRVRYEDFVDSPDTVLADVMALAGLEGPPPVNAQGEAVVGVNHTVTGNPDRLSRGPLRIRPDDAWRSGLPKRDALVATALALPLLRRYGYRVAPWTSS